MKVAFQIDEPGAVTVHNCTLALMEEAQHRGYQPLHFTPQGLVLKDNRLFARAGDLRVNPEASEFITVTHPRLVNLEDMDVIFVRQDPTFNMGYLSATYLLERLQDKVLIINNPVSVRNAPEKLSFFGFDEYKPPTLVTSDIDEIEAFWQHHGDIVLKPLFCYGGRGVFHIGETSDNLRVAVEVLASNHRCPLVAQKFIPEIRCSDRRVLLLFGAVAGCYGRVPGDKGIRSNFFSGGRLIAATLSEIQQDIAQRLAEVLLAEGIYIAGVDFIGDYLTEINVTTPAGFLPMRRLYNRHPERYLWHQIEHHVRYGGTWDKTLEP